MRFKKTAGSNPAVLLFRAHNGSAFILADKQRHLRVAPDNTLVMMLLHDLTRMIHKIHKRE